MGKKIYLSILLVFLVSACMTGGKPLLKTEPALASNTNATIVTYAPIVVNNTAQSVCAPSRLGSILFQEATTGESTAPYLEDLTLEGYTGLTASPTYDLAAAHFPNLPGWDRTFVCNSHECLQQRASRASAEGVAYEYLAYDPERHEGVPPEEQGNLPWATQVAREISDEWGKPLIISYSTKQLHQEAEERGYDWDDPSAVVAMLAPYGDIWLIQAADEFWRLEDNTIRPILSQRVYPPGAEFRAQVQRWVDWIHAANPDIKIWIQLAPQRIGVVGENQPSADLLLEYRNSIADLVDGIYITTIYGSVEQFPLANQEMVEVFHRACVTDGMNTTVPGTANPKTEKTVTPAPQIVGAIPSATQTIYLPIVGATMPPNGISLVEEGWTDNLSIPDLTLIPGFYYRVYENTQYPCGVDGFHQFMVLDRGEDMQAPRDLFVKFPGGSVGFYYEDAGGERTYYPNPLASGLLSSDYFSKMFFRTSVSEEHANGVTKKIREDGNFRIMVVSYCSHDLYHGSGEYNEVDGFSRYGYQAAMSAVDYVQAHFNSTHLITYGGSAGAAGSFYIGKDQDNVAGIIMDSQAVDLTAISQACKDGINVFGHSYPCFCPDGGQTCMEVLAPRIGFTLQDGDEPYHFVANGLDIPIYLVWNERDASKDAHLQYDNLHNALVQYNPGGSSVANKVCITDPLTPPGPICNLHVPSAYDYLETSQLVEEIYNWILSRLAMN